jgi:hypothetical protein
MLKKDFDDSLKSLALTRSSFAELTGVSYLGTVTKWDDESRPIPSWVSSWLENYSFKKKFLLLKNVFEDSKFFEDSK